MTQVQKPLPESLMKTIRAAVQSPDMTPGEKFEAVVLVSHGYGLFTAAAGTIDPTAYAIPETQWTEIADLLMNLESGGVAKVNMSLDWMNMGPSGYGPSGHKEAPANG